MIEHRKYLVYYGSDSWNYGYWKAIFQNPPCKKPDTPKNKEYDFDIEMKGKELKEIYLQLIGESTDLNIIEFQLAKYKIARIEQNRNLILIYKYQPIMNLEMFYKFCRDKDYIISKRITIPAD